MKQLVTPLLNLTEELFQVLASGRVGFWGVFHTVDAPSQI